MKDLDDGSLGAQPQARMSDHWKKSSFKIQKILWGGHQGDEHNKCEGTNGLVRWCSLKRKDPWRKA